MQTQSNFCKSVLKKEMTLVEPISSLPKTDKNSSLAQVEPKSNSSTVIWSKGISEMAMLSYLTDSPVYTESV
jgi:hypothetical protein